ncbi:MAG: GNAT family N-acetyltransferase [Legionella sp.]|nr:MAG: GNAT family N-acetyltransferase [Legionella sp.]PJD98548.1 MAG: GNAT family N-acetyltransferase [Legionella sp.]
MDTAWVEKVTELQKIKSCLAIRYQVFVEGQKVPIHEEIDGLDSLCEQYLLWFNGFPVGTARVRYIQDSAKIERVAIIETYQKQGLGRMLMLFMLKDIQQHPQVKRVTLGAQTHAICFYEKLGFTICSEEYLDAGIPHQDMQLYL